MDLRNHQVYNLGSVMLTGENLFKIITFYITTPFTLRISNEPTTLSMAMTESAKDCLVAPYAPIYKRVDSNTAR